MDGAIASFCKLVAGNRSQDIAQAQAQVEEANASVRKLLAGNRSQDIAKIQVGQIALIKVDAYTGKTFEGKVTQVATQSLVQQNVTSFEVKVAVTDSQRLLYEGMNVTIDFKAGELNQVLIVPTA